MDIGVGKSFDRLIDLYLQKRICSEPMTFLYASSWLAWSDPGDYIACLLISTCISDYGKYREITN